MQLACHQSEAGVELVAQRIALGVLQRVDGAVDALENTERDSLRDELDARFALMAGELHRLFAVLESALRFSRAEA